MAYTSAFTQLRTKEQLGYIVSAFARKTAGSTWGMSVVIQSSKALPSVLEERCEAWLEAFRQELEEMPAEEVAQEASAVVAQLLEKETKMSQEVSRVWGEILNTEGFSDRMRNPSFDRLDRLARELTIGEGSRFTTEEQLKARVLRFFDEHFSAKSTSRRAMTARVYNQKSKMHYDASVGEPGVLSSYSDMRHFKQYMSSWPVAPYWRVVDESATALQR
jgi:insulysin